MDTDELILLGFGHERDLEVAVKPVAVQSLGGRQVLGAAALERRRSDVRSAGQVRSGQRYKEVTGTATVCTKGE